MQQNRQCAKLQRFLKPYTDCCWFAFSTSSPLASFACRSCWCFRHIGLQMSLGRLYSMEKVFSTCGVMKWMSCIKLARHPSTWQPHIYLHVQRPTRSFVFLLGTPGVRFDLNRSFVTRLGDFGALRYCWPRCEVSVQIVCSQIPESQKRSSCNDNFFFGWGKGFPMRTLLHNHFIFHSLLYSSNNSARIR